MGSIHTQTKLFAASVRWIARAASLLSIATILAFFGDFQPGKVRPREWIGLLFFPFGVIVGMLISWLREFAGAVLSLLSLTAFYFFYGVFLNGRWPGGWAFLVFTTPAFLFLASWLLARSQMRQHSLIGH